MRQRFSKLIILTKVKAISNKKEEKTALGIRGKAPVYREEFTVRLLIFS